MAVVSFDVSDELAQQIRGLIVSGRESRIAFYLRGRRVVSVSAENVWLNETADTSAPVPVGCDHLRAR